MLGELLKYDFFTNALIACVLSGISCGLIGTYIVCRRLVFLSGGITHASFGGIGMAYYMGINPIVGAFVFSILSALGIEGFSQRGRIREDSAIGILWSLGMAVGIVFIYLTPGYAPNLMTYLFGNVLSVRMNDLIAIGILDVILILLFILFHRPITYISFDRSYSGTQNMPTKIVGYMMMILIAATIVLSIRIVGIVLLISLLTMPTVAVNSLTKSYTKLLVYSSLIAILSSVTGLIISYNTDIPSGASIILTLFIIIIITKIVAWFNRKRYIRIF